MDELTASNPNSIQKMFGSISKNYDLANTVLSFGIHHRWKKNLIKFSQVKAHDHILDCATGTGDLAFLFEKALHNTGQVIGCDFCEPMLEIAKQKAKAKGSQVKFEVADALQLPYSDQQFNIASISFGIRNVKKPPQALRELARVVKPGGRVLILEFGNPANRPMKQLYQLYSTRILPTLGGWMSGQKSAYHYLQTSSSQFPCGAEFLKMVDATHRFSKTKAIPLQLGVAYLYVLEVR